MIRIVVILFLCILARGITYAQSPPTALAATNLTSGSFTANWSSVSGATSYLLEVASEPGFSNFSSYTILSPETSEDIGRPNGYYYYRLRAVTMSGPTGYSNTITVNLNPPSPPVLAPGTPTSTSIAFSWPAVVGALNYQWQISKSPEFWSVVNSNSTSALTQTVTGLTTGTMYYVRARSTNNIGASNYSAVISVMTTGAPQPPSPTSLYADNITGVSFTAHWELLGGVTYYIDVSTNSNFSTTPTPAFSASYQSATNSLNVTGLSPMITYYFRVRSFYTAGGYSSYSANGFALTVLIPPSTITITDRTSSSFTTTWNAVAGASGYQLELSRSKTFDQVYSTYTVAGGSNSTYTVNNLPNKFSYYLRIKSTSAQGTSGYSNIVLAADLDYNFIRSTDVTVPGKLTVTDVENAGIQERITSMAFFDGLGRPLQTVAVNASPSQNDIVQPVAYDQFGREAVKYLPFVYGNDGWIKPNFKTKDNAGYTTSPQYQFYQGTAKVPTDTKPYAETRFKTDPLSRPVEQGSPGAAWQPDATDSYYSTDRTIKSAYVANVVNEVKLWVYTPPTSTTPIRVVSNSYYPANQLFKTMTMDEDSNEVYEYRNKQGQVILKKVEAPGGVWAETYYIYDDVGNLVVVLPPEATKGFSN